MPIYAFGGGRPIIGPRSFVHPDAVIIGHVSIGPSCFIGPGAYLRGDWVSIEIGVSSNVQEACTIHGIPAQKCFWVPIPIWGTAALFTVPASKTTCSWG